jgi:hypothetical protein
MNIYRINSDSGRYEYVNARVEDRDLLFFSSGQPLSGTWVPVPVLLDHRLVDNVMEEPQPRKGDFPSLYGATPIFSERAWETLYPLVGGSVEALPLIHPSGEKYFAINVLDVVDCLDLTKTKLTRNDVTGRVSSIQEYHFRQHLLTGKHIFKLPETKGLEVLVSEEFKQAVETSELKGLIFRRLN